MKYNKVLITKKLCHQFGVHQWVRNYLKHHKLMNRPLIYILTYIKGIYGVDEPVSKELIGVANMVIAHKGFIYNTHGQVISPSNDSDDRFTIEWKDHKITRMLTTNGELYMMRAYHGNYLVQEITHNDHNEHYTLNVFGYDDNWSLFRYYSTPNTTVENFKKNNHVDVSETFEIALSTNIEDIIVQENFCKLIGLPTIYHNILNDFKLYNKSIKVAFNTLSIIPATIDPRLLGVMLHYLDDHLTPFFDQHQEPIIDENQRVIEVQSMDTSQVIRTNEWVGSKLMITRDSDGDIVTESRWEGEKLVKVIESQYSRTNISTLSNHDKYVPDISFTTIDHHPQDSNLVLH